MSHRWLTRNDLSSARWAQDVFNSQVKRGLIDESVIIRTQYVVCGCGEEGCGFISSLRKQEDE